MRRLVLGLVAIGLAGSSLAVGCSDEGEGSGGSADSSTSPSTVTSGPTTKTGSTASSTSIGTGNQQCTELTAGDFVRNAAIGYVLSLPMTAGAEPDELALEFYEVGADPFPTGTIDLGAGENANYQSCSTCVVYREDFGEEGPNKVFFQQSGTMSLGATSFPAPTGELTDVTLIEVTIADTFLSTPVEGGGCYHIAGAPLAFEPAPAEWACDPLYYDDKVDCDCADCGVVDADCVANLPPVDCFVGQTCNTTTLVCEGTPTAWTCDPSEFNGGAGNGCDCDCGMLDPDCELTPEEPEQGCTGNEICNDTSGACVPAGWTCNIDFFATGIIQDCDCGCGVVDPDCADATEASCNYCNDMGSCAESAADCASASINATNNAICD
ncbi:MAG: hypothetical protein HOV80_11615 [Polyangiaceae bacterium]|nr:hypothetical protein [Polyangiaceae bacterium]